MKKLTVGSKVISIAIIVLLATSAAISAQPIQTSVTLQMTIRSSSKGPVYRVEGKVIPFSNLLDYFQKRLINKARESKVQVAMDRDVPLNVSSKVVGILQKVGCDVDTYLFTGEFTAKEFELKLNGPAVVFYDNNSKK